MVGERLIRASVRPDGALLIQAGIFAAESPLMLISTDDGATVRPIEPGPGAAARAVDRGFAQCGWPVASDCWVSTDGIAWSYVAVPKVS